MSDFSQNFERILRSYFAVCELTAEQLKEDRLYGVSVEHKHEKVLERYMARKFGPRGFKNGDVKTPRKEFSDDYRFGKKVDRCFHNALDHWILAETDTFTYTDLGRAGRIMAKVHSYMDLGVHISGLVVLGTGLTYGACDCLSVSCQEFDIELSMGNWGPKDSEGRYTVKPITL